MIFPYWLTISWKTLQPNTASLKKHIDKKAIDLLQKYNWTGNIRELRNVVERLIILSGKTITVEDVENYVLPRK